MLLRMGSTGKDVQAVQRQLRVLEPGLAMDGVFGRKTEQAVRLYQRRNGLYPPDGIVGPVTYAALFQGNTAPGRDTPRPKPPQPDRVGKTVKNAADRARDRPMPKGEAMAVSGLNISRFGQKFIFEHEAQRGVSNRLHHPSSGSGVTIGPGYDMKDRSSETIQRDLETIGVPRAVAKAASLGAGKWGKGAAEFVRQNKDLVDLNDGQQQALLAHIVPHYQNMVKRAIKVPLHQYEFDALVSYAYNPGGGWRKVTSLVNEGRGHDAMLEIKRHVYSKGQRIRSLVVRREAEAVMFLYGEYR